MNMTATPSKEEIVQLVMKHERLLALLYQVFEDRFPEHQAMWSRLMKDHYAHVSVLDELLERSEQRRALAIDAGTFNSSTIQYAVEYVSGQIMKTLSNNELDAPAALGLCKSLEESGLVQRFYEIFRPVSRDMESEFIELDRHIAERQEVLQNYTESCMKVA